MKKKKKKKIVPSPNSFGEEAIVKVEGGFIGLVSHTHCKTSLQSSLLKITVRKKRG